MLNKNKTQTHNFSFLQSIFYSLLFNSDNLHIFFPIYLHFSNIFCFILIDLFPMCKLRLLRKSVAWGRKKKVRKNEYIVSNRNQMKKGSQTNLLGNIH